MVAENNGNGKRIKGIWDLFGSEKMQLKLSALLIQQKASSRIVPTTISN